MPKNNSKYSNYFAIMSRFFRSCLPSFCSTAEILEDVAARVFIPNQELEREVEAGIHAANVGAERIITELINDTEDAINIDQITHNPNHPDIEDASRVATRLTNTLIHAATEVAVVAAIHELGQRNFGSLAGPAETAIRTAADDTEYVVDRLIDAAAQEAGRIEEYLEGLREPNTEAEENQANIVDPDASTKSSNSEDENYGEQAFPDANFAGLLLGVVLIAYNSMFYDYDS